MSRLQPVRNTVAAIFTAASAGIADSTRNPGYAQRRDRAHRATHRPAR